jgi:hypothetical protein
MSGLAPQQSHPPGPISFALQQHLERRTKRLLILQPGLDLRSTLFPRGGLPRQPQGFGLGLFSACVRRGLGLTQVRHQLRHLLDRGQGRTGIGTVLRRHERYRHYCRTSRTTDLAARIQIGLVDFECTLVGERALGGNDAAGDPAAHGDIAHAAIFRGLAGAQGWHGGKSTRLSQATAYRGGNG